jgi:signal transduction histidine kinase
MVKHAREIVKNTLEFSRRDRLERYEPVDLKSVVELALTSERRMLEDHNVILDLQIESVPLVANKDALLQVFSNIVRNAIEAMSEGGTLAIRTEVEHKDNIVHTRITDTGVGIPAKIRDKLFEPFFTTKGDTGTGLGLFICSEIIKDHRGSIKVQSKAGKGTTFTVSIPVARQGAQ